MPVPIRLGTLVVAKRPTAICQIGEIGVCYEVFRRPSGENGYSFIFERGGYDGFTVKEVQHFLSVSRQIDPTIATYRFSNVLALERDYRSGLFRQAFSTPVLLHTSSRLASDTR